MAWTLVWGRMAIIYSLVTSSDAEYIADPSRWVVRVGMTVFVSRLPPLREYQHHEETMPISPPRISASGAVPLWSLMSSPRDRPTTEDQSGWTSISVRPCNVRVAPVMSSGVNSTL